MRSIDTLIIGGGQAGLAMSRALTERGVEHVVLERGRIGERWRSERWDSLRLLTPRWLSRLSGWHDDGTDRIDGDPDGFMTRREVIGYLERHAAWSRAPVLDGVTVIGVERVDGAFRVDTDRGQWAARAVVVATGESQDAAVPPISGSLAPDLHQVVPTRYRNPDTLPEGGVLVVGASATGAQLAQEIHASGRPVILSVGRHTRLPRRYRGRDILEWFHTTGLLGQRADDLPNLHASLEQPSLQLTGSDDGRALDLRRLQEEGVRLVGPTEGALDRRVFLCDELVEALAAADLKLASQRLRIDQYIEEMGLESEVDAPEPFEPVPLPDAPPASLDLRAEGVRTVVWATGFRRSYPWLRVPVLDAAGHIRHRGGVTSVPGLYVLGLNLLRTRMSSFLGGVGDDAEALAEHLGRARGSGTAGAAPSPRDRGADQTRTRGRAHRVA